MALQKVNKLCYEVNCLQRQIKGYVDGSMTVKKTPKNHNTVTRHTITICYMCTVL